MSVSMRLKRFGSKKRPYYRVVVMDSRAAATSRTIDEIGTYHPIEAEDRQTTIDAEKAAEWLKKGANPSATVKKSLNAKGISCNRTVQG